MSKPRSLLDRNNSFGWLSIGLHWFATVAIILLWFIGQSIALQSIEQIDARRSLHVTLGLIVWLPLFARIVWRFKAGHPHVNGQTVNDTSTGQDGTLCDVAGIDGHVDIWAANGLGDARAQCPVGDCLLVPLPCR